MATAISNAKAIWLVGLDYLLSLITSPFWIRANIGRRIKLVMRVFTMINQLWASVAPLPSNMNYEIYHFLQHAHQFIQMASESHKYHAPYQKVRYKCVYHHQMPKCFNACAQGRGRGFGGEGKSVSSQLISFIIYLSLHLILIKLYHIIIYIIQYALHL